MKFLDRLLERFQRRQADEPAPLPVAKSEFRGPVEHAATGRPFSRRQRQLRNRAASHSRAVNRRMLR